MESIGSEIACSGTTAAAVRLYEIQRWILGYDPHAVAISPETLVDSQLGTAIHRLHSPQTTQPTRVSSCRHCVRQVLECGDFPPLCIELHAHAVRHYEFKSGAEAPHSKTLRAVRPGLRLTGPNTQDCDEPTRPLRPPGRGVR